MLLKYYVKNPTIAINQITQYIQELKERLGRYSTHRGLGLSIIACYLERKFVDKAFEEYKSNTKMKTVPMAQALLMTAFRVIKSQIFTHHYKDTNETQKFEELLADKKLTGLTSADYGVAMLHYSKKKDKLKVQELFEEARLQKKLNSYLYGIMMRISKTPEEIEGFWRDMVNKNLPLELGSYESKAVAYLALENIPKV